MIPEYLLAKIEKSDVIYRCIGNEMKNGILACGFMRKETADRSQYHFSNEYYSCFVLLRGSGEYIAEDGTSYPLQAGSLVQRLPGVPHSTRVDPDGKWLEFFISIGKPFFDFFLLAFGSEPGAGAKGRAASRRSRAVSEASAVVKGHTGQSAAFADSGDGKRDSANVRLPCAPGESAAGSDRGRLRYALAES